MKNDSIEKMENILLRAWSLESSSKWTKENPAKGQCGVTSLIVNDILGGEILKTKVNGNWHYYNKINGNIYDFTKSQFDSKISYDNIQSNRREAFSDTNNSQYNYLHKTVKNYYLKRDNW